MVSTIQDTALAELMKEEAQTLARLLSGPDRCVMVNVTIAHNNPAATVDTVRAIEGDTHTGHARQFIRSVMHTLKWLDKTLFQCEGDKS